MKSKFKSIYLVFMFFSFSSVFSFAETDLLGSWIFKSKVCELKAPIEAPQDKRNTKPADSIQSPGTQDDEPKSTNSYECYSMEHCAAFNLGLRHNFYSSEPLTLRYQLESQGGSVMDYQGPMSPGTHDLKALEFAYDNAGQPSKKPPLYTFKLYFYKSSDDRNQILFDFAIQSGQDRNWLFVGKLMITYHNQIELNYITDDDQMFSGISPRVAQRKKSEYEYRINDKTQLVLNYETQNLKCTERWSTDASS